MANSPPAIAGDLGKRKCNQKFTRHVGEKETSLCKKAASYCLRLKRNYKALLVAKNSLRQWFEFEVLIVGYETCFEMMDIKQRLHMKLKCTILFPFFCYFRQSRIGGCDLE